MDGSLLADQEAPGKVDMQDGTQNQSAKIEKSLQTMKVSFEKAPTAAGCNVKAQLYVCNDANTYCLPIKQEFDCQKLQVKN